MTRFWLRLAAVYTFAIWIWTGDRFWAVLVVLASIAYGFSAGVQMQRQERDQPLTRTMICFTWMRRLGIAGVNGWATALALYGVLVAYPAAWGHPPITTIVDLRPVDGSLVRGAGLVGLWVLGAAVTVGINLYRDYADSQSEEWDLESA